jgi:hypothetical protein
VIERILAVVDGRPLLQTEVALVEVVRGLDREAALEALIDERLMLREASRLPQTAVGAEDEERALASLRARFPEQTRDVSEVDLRRLARRQTAILKYVEYRFRPLVRVKDDELRRTYQERHAGRKGAPAFEAVAGPLREELEAAELGRRIEAWVAELRAGAEIRYNR